MTLKKIGLAVAVFFLMLGAPLYGERDSDKLQKALKLQQKGVKALEQGDAGKGEKYFRKALDAFPSLPQAHMGLGHICMQKKEHEKALAAYQAAVKGYEETGNLLYDFELKRYQDAQTRIAGLREDITILQSPTIKLNEDQKQARIVALENQMRQLRLVDHPGDRGKTETPAEVHFFVGNALFRLDRTAEAVKVWESCLAKNPKLADVHNNLAVAYWMLTRYEDAQKSVAEAEALGFEVNPDFKADLELSIYKASKK
ncbi:tetratricopeptide repeat protein [Acidobacteriota bacterium]